MLARPRAWLHAAASWLDRAAFSPASLPDDLITGIAIAPAIGAGLIIFKLPAVKMLAVALAFGIAAHLVAQWVWRRQIPPPQPSAVIAAVVGVALVGPGAALSTSIEIAALAVILELLRARYVPAIRAQTGLLAFAAVAVITRGAPLAYINPASGKPFPDPIALVGSSRVDLQACKLEYSIVSPK